MAQGLELGYVRVSDTDQNTARQIAALLERGIPKERIYIDKKSGKNADRPQLKEMLAFCRKGDCVVVTALDRLGRNTKDLLAIIEELTEKGVEFVSLNEQIDTTTPAGRFVLTVFAAMAQMERENILERQRQGIAIAKQIPGKYTGRKPIAIDEKEFRRQVRQWQNGDITAREAMRRLGLSSSTFYRKLKEYGVEATH